MQWNILEGSEQKHRVKIGETSIRATTWIVWCEETDSLEGSVDFGDAAAEQEYYARFERGDLANVVIRVMATWQDAEGFDVLGGCHLETKELEYAIGATAEEHGMRMEALKMLQQEILKRANLYKFKGV